MTTHILAERELAFENKFAHDLAADFKAKARGRGKLAAWLGSVLKLNDNETMRVTRELVNALVVRQTELEMVQKLRREFNVQAAEVTDEELLRRAAEFNDAARREVFAGVV